LKTRAVARRGRPLLGVLIILLALAASFFWFRYSAASQKERIAYLENLSTRLRSETVPIKFMVLSREGGEIRARLKLYDLSGRELAVLEKSWPGSELSIDMLLVPLGREKLWLAFPYRIFTDKLSAALGTLLFDSYDRGGFPQVLGGVEWSARERATIAAIFSSVRKSASAGAPATEAAPGAFGSAVHELARLSRFEVGIVYKVVCRAKGGVEIAED
jgi:hypothetical protein